MISVLIIDDNHSFIDSLKVILKEVNVVSTVRSVTNFRLGQAELEKSQYQLIIMENDTEVATKGIDFVRSAKRNYDYLIPENFILLSTKPQDFAEKAKLEGVKVFRKPLNVNDFKEYVNRLFEHNLLRSKEES